MNRKKWILDVVLILAANTMYALGVVMFLLPNGFIMGGTTGLALAAQVLQPQDLEAYVLAQIHGALSGESL